MREFRTSGSVGASGSNPRGDPTLFLGAAAGSEGPQGVRGEGEIGRHRGVFEVTVVGGEQIELVILRAQMVNPLAVDHHPQLKSPDRQLKPGLEAIDISSDRRPARLGGDQRFHPGPLTEGHFDRVEATQAGEQLEQILLEKGRVHAEFQRQRAPQARANLADQFAYEALRTLAVVDVAGAVLEPEDLAGLRQVGEQRVVTGVLGVMRVKAACSPSHFTTGTDDGAVEVDSQTPKTEFCDLLIEQFAVEAHQRAQRSLGKLLEPVDHRAVAGNTRQTAEPSEQ
jgi:hypothetical protein